MQRDNASLLDIARFSGLILEFTESMSQDEFNEDIKTQAAVLYYLTIIGEAIQRNIPELIEAIAPLLPIEEE